MNRQLMIPSHSSRAAPGMALLTALAGFVLAQTSALPPGMPPRPPTSGLSTNAEPAVSRGATPEVRDCTFNYNNAPLDLVIQDYAAKTGRTPLISPRTPKVAITLRSQGKLTQEEWIEALDAILAMNGISVLRQRDRFLKVVPSQEALQEAPRIQEDAAKATVGERSEFVSQLILLKHLDLGEAEKAIKPLLHTFGKVDRLDRINAILVTDTAANVNRVLQILSYVDQALPVREEPVVVPIRYAKASAIKQKLEEIIAQSKEEQKKIVVPTPRRAGSPGVEPRTVPTPPVIPGVIRPPITPVPSHAAAKAPTEEFLELAERGIIRGKVQITADDRTNQLIIITTPENMKFLEKIIKVLDVETTPDVVVKVIRLEHADAETVASTINTLIGGKPRESLPTPPPVKEGQSAQEQAAALRDYVARLQADRTRAAAQPPAGSGEALKTKIGELSADNIKLLPDKRSNSILVMASLSDFNQIRELVKCLDIMLAQVLIEAIIMEVKLGDTIQTGVDWVQRAMVAYDKGGNGVQRSPLLSFSGGGGGGLGEPQPALSAAVNAGAGLTYYLTYFGLNLDAILNMASSDNRSRILASPVIATHDNVEATINVGEQRYFYKGQRWIQDTPTSGHYEQDVESRNVGIVLTVKPRINEKNLVVMDIKQTIDEVAEGGQTIGDTVWPITMHREMNASVAVRDRETILLGGLVRHRRSRSRSGIPLLHRIPILGVLFGRKDYGVSRDEVIVFLTPYVMNTPEQAMAEAQRRKLHLRTEGLWTRGWSDSPLAEGPSSTPAPSPPGGATRRKAPNISQGTFALPSSVAGLDAELLRFIIEQERRYGPAAEETDRKLQAEIRPPSP